MTLSDFDAVVSVIAAVVLFVQGLQGFSRDLRQNGGSWLQPALASATRTRVGGFCLGAAATAVIQSSSATVSIALALLSAGLISFEASLTVLLGANLGTTATAWLVSFKLNGIGPWLIVIGALLTIFREPVSLVGGPCSFLASYCLL